MSMERYNRADHPSPVRIRSVAPTGVTRQRRGPGEKTMPKNTKVHFKNGSISEPPIGTVIAISGQLQNSYGEGAGRVYDYAAIRAGNGRWYTTGQSCPTFGYNWQGLLGFLQTFIDPTGERLR